MKLDEINHFSHRHTLKLKRPGKPYKCDGCKELGFGFYYGCSRYKDCNFHLHEKCATIDYSRSEFHPFFKKSNFIPQKKPLSERRCDACGKDILGYAYHCSKTLYDLHPCCLKLSHNLNHSKFDLHLQLVDKTSKKCSKCNSKEIAKKLRGWSYVSSCGDFCFHVACVKELILENYKKYYFDRRNGEIEARRRRSALQFYSQGTKIVRQGKSREKAETIWKITKMIFKIIVSAIFGDPTGGILSLIEALFY